MTKDKKQSKNLIQEKIFQTTVRLPESLHRAFKAKCASEGEKITYVLEKLIREYVSKGG